MLRRFRVERRALPRRSGPHTPTEIRSAGLRAVSAELGLRPLADDVARELRGRRSFPRHFVSSQVFGV